MKNANVRLSLLFIVLISLLFVGPSSGQDQEITEALDLANAPLVVEFNTAAAGPPIFELLTDDRAVFKINAQGTVSGDLDGTMSATITQLNNLVEPGFDPISIPFTIETDQGTIEGYYAGTFYHSSEDAEFAEVSGHGYILSVSGAYADLFLADVFVTSQVQMVDDMGVGESGTMTITSR